MPFPERILKAGDELPCPMNCPFSALAFTVWKASLGSFRCGKYHSQSDGSDQFSANSSGNFAREALSYAEEVLGGKAGPGLLLPCLCVMCEKRFSRVCGQNARRGFLFRIIFRFLRHGAGVLARPPS